MGEDIGLTEEQEAARKRLLKRLRRDRFKTDDAARTWIATGKVPGYGDRTALEMIREGRVDSVIEVIDALDAGVYQ